MARYDFIAVYILASQRNGTLYTGVTSDLPARIYLHRTGRIRGFTQDYACKTLAWFERHALMREAIAQEKRIKRWRRAWKLELIEKANPQWRDLFLDFANPAPPTFACPLPSVIPDSARR
jgi:putative endonuclease